MYGPRGKRNEYDAEKKQRFQNEHFCDTEIFVTVSTITFLEKL
jgi:hypothetical protein